MRYLIALAALVAGSAPACSLVNLSGEIEQAQCASHDDCEVLNDRSASDFDPCTPWQCAETSYCERYPLDLDYDTFTPHTVEHEGEELVCQETASLRDCDDELEDSNPDELEACDSFDNDCDSHVDEGVLEHEPVIATAFANENAEGVGETSYAIDPDSGTVAAAYGLRRGASSVPGFSTIASTLGSGSEVRPLEHSRPLLADSAAVGALGGDRFVIAFMNESGGRHLVAVTTGEGAAVRGSDDVMRRGLLCAASESCAPNAELGPADVLVPAPLSNTPAVAVNDADVLVVTARAAEGDGACTALGSDGEPALVLANALVHNATAGELTEREGPALALGQTTDRNTPAVVALPGLGFVVAFANADGAIEILRVFVEGGELQSSPLHGIEADTERFSDVALALGANDAGERRVGLAAKVGCGAAARVMFYILTSPASESEVSRIDVGPVSVGGSPNEGQPSVAWSDARDAWLVAYRDGSGMRARVLTAAGSALGAESYPLFEEVDSGEDALRLAASPFAVPLETSAGWFGAIAVTERAEDYVIQTVALSSCE